MRPAVDVRDEMTNDRLDEAFERFLAGRPVPAEAAPLVAFANEVRALAVHPGRPSPQLAELLATGLAHRSGHEGGAGSQDSGVGATEKATHPGWSTGRCFGQGDVRRSRRSGGDRPGHRPGRCDGSRSSRSPTQPPPGQRVGRARGRDAGRSCPTPPTTGRPRTSSLPRRKSVSTGTGGASQDGEPPAETPAHAEFGRQVSERAQAGGVDGQEVSDEARTGSHRPDVPTPAPQRPATQRPCPRLAPPCRARRRTRARAAPGRP